MDGMFIIIIIYVVFICALRIYKRKLREEQFRERRQNAQDKRPRTEAPVQQRPGQTRTDYNAGTVPEKEHRSAFGAFAAHKDAAPAQETQPEQMSTTAYLQKKADEDAIEHEKEAHMEKMRASRETGGLPSGQRLYDGDPVPNGMICVKCGYCGAENLVPQMARVTHTCYFCREELH